MYLSFHLKLLAYEQCSNEEKTSDYNRMQQADIFMVNIKALLI